MLQLSIQLAKDSDGFSGAEIALVCREAGLRALTEQIETKKAEEIYVQDNHFMEALEGVKMRGKKKDKTSLFNWI